MSAIQLQAQYIDPQPIPSIQIRPEQVQLQFHPLTPPLDEEQSINNNEQSQQKQQQSTPTTIAAADNTQGVKSNNKSLTNSSSSFVVGGDMENNQSMIGIGQGIINNGDGQSFGLFPIIIAGSLLLLLLLIVFGRKKKGNQRQIALIGQRNSGKTQLFVKLNQGKIYQSVPSIRNNTTIYKSESSGKQYQMIDFCGDNISKEQVLQPEYYQKNIHTIVQVIDGTDHKKLSDCSLFIYRLLVSKLFQARECNYILFLNKEDDTDRFLSETKIIKRLEDEIQHIKVSRKNNAEEDTQFEQDYLKTTKQRIDLRKTAGIIIVCGSAKSGNIKALESAFQNIL